MQPTWTHLLIAIAALCPTADASTTNLTVQLNGSQPLSRRTIHYECDQHAVAMGLPTAAFAVEYINGDGNSLVIVPVHDMSMIFANVTSGSGARYAAGPYIWWEAGGAVNFYSDSIAGKMQSACHTVQAK